MKQFYTKRNSILIKLCLFLLLAGTIYSCKKDISHFNQSPAAEVLAAHDVDIAMLQKAYNDGINNRSPRTASTQTPINIINNLNVDWTTYTLYTYPDSTQLIEFAMPDDKSLLVPDSVSQAGRGKYNSKTSAVFILHKDTVSMSFFMKTVEDGSAAGYQSVLENLHYKQIPLGFTGNVYYFTLGKQYINGWGWENGGLKDILAFTNSAQPQTQNISINKIKTNLLTANCYDEVWDHYIWTGTGANRVYEYQYTFYVTKCTLVSSPDDPDNNNNGGGVNGDNTPPPVPCIPPTPPAVESVKGRIKINLVEGGEGGGGGGTPQPCPEKIRLDIVDSLKNKCLKDVLAKLKMDKNLNNKISEIIQNIFNKNDKVNITFKEYTDPSAGPARTEVPDRRNGVFNETINLNLAHFNGSSQEFAAIVMVHEVLHAYMNYDNKYYLNQLAQHQDIAERYVYEIKNLILNIYPGMDEKDAYAIILNGLKDALGPSKDDFIQLLNKQYKVNDPFGIYESYRNGFSGTKCK